MKDYPQLTIETGAPYLLVAADPASGWPYPVAYTDVPGVLEQDTAVAARIRDTWNACIGLDLPENGSPGVLEEIVSAARALVAAYGARGYGVGTEVENLEATLLGLGIKINPQRV